MAFSEYNTTKIYNWATRTVHKFGYNASVGTAFETVWDGGATYQYPTSATTAVVTSSNTTADDGGTVQVFGLDQNYNLIDEVLTIGGSAGTKTFIRVFRATLKNANTGVANVGTLTVTVNSIAVAQIQPTYGQTLMAVYTIPAGKRGLLIQVDAGSSKDQEHEIRLVGREIENGNAFSTKSFLTMRGNFVEKNLYGAVIFPQKTDIEIQAKSGATSAVSAGFELVLQPYPS